MALFKKKPLPGSVPAFFLHMQKTAGTSLIELVRPYYGSSMTSHGEFWGKPHEALGGVGFISGHIGYDFARFVMPGRYSFTFLRNPRERILSLYYFCQARDPGEFEIYRMARDMSLPEFLEAGLSDPCVKMHIWNNQVWQLAHGYSYFDQRSVDDFSETELLQLARKNIGEFSHVGFTETIAVDFAHVLQQLGIPKAVDMPKTNATPGRPGLADQPATVRRLLDRLTELDRDLYDYARNELFPERRMKRWKFW